MNSTGNWSRNSTEVWSSSANPYASGWRGFEVLLSAAVIVSGITYAFTQFHSPTNKSSYARLTKYLCAHGAIWSLVCLAQCVYNDIHQHFVMNYSLCEIQSMYMYFFIMMNGCCLCIHAYSSERRVALIASASKDTRHPHKWLQSDISIFLAHAICAMFCAVLALITNLAIAKPVLEPSETFCFLFLRDKSEAFLLFCPLLFFTLFLIHRYMFKLAARFSTHRVAPKPISVTRQGILVPPLQLSPLIHAHAERRIARRMGLFVISYVACCMPSALITLCQAISPQSWISTNPVFFLVAAHLTHANVIVNTLVYVWLNRQFRSEFMKAMVSWRWSPTHPTHPLLKETKKSAKKGSGNDAVSRSQSSSTIYILQFFCCGYRVPSFHTRKMTPNSSRTPTSPADSDQRRVGFGFRRRRRPRSKSLQLPNPLHVPVQLQHFLSSSYLYHRKTTLFDVELPAPRREANPMTHSLDIFDDEEIGAAGSKNGIHRNLQGYPIPLPTIKHGAFNLRHIRTRQSLPHNYFQTNRDFVFNQ